MRGIVAERRRAGRVGPVVRAAVARVALLVLAAAPLGGCYVMQAASGQADLLSRARPIEQVLADPATPEATRRRIDLAVEARDFAERELGLPAGGSYGRYADLGRPYAVWNVVATPEFSLVPRRWCYPVAGCVTYRGYFHERDARSYADLGRPYAVWNVVATPEFSLAPRRWCYPIAGCVTYRGYFHERDARRYADGLTAAGDDTLVEGVAAYSTLGHFDDPLLNTMMGWSDARLVGTVFHELAHRRLYVPGDSAFNEGYASVVEAAGLRLWFESRGEQAALDAWLESRRRREQFLALLAGTASGLRALYLQPLDPESMRIEKNRMFGELKYQYTRLREDWGGWAGYDAWFARPLDNADLASIGTYDDCVPGLQRELESAGSLEAFHVRAEELARMDRASRHRAVCTTTRR